MTANETLHARMRAFLGAHRDRDPHQLAEQFARGCAKTDLLPLVAEKFWTLIRADVRLDEFETFRASADRPSLARARNEITLADLAPLLDEPYRVGDGKTRRFRHMTAIEHQTRIALLHGQMTGLQRAIEVHEAALSLIATHGVACLDDIPPSEELAA